MKYLGLIVLIIGIVWGIFAFTMPTTVETGGEMVGSGKYSIYIPKSEVHNIGLIDNRRNQIIIAALMVISGIILFCFGTVTESKASANSGDMVTPEHGGFVKNDYRKCPACAESIKVEALKCKHCGELFNFSDVERIINERKITKEEYIKRNRLELITEGNGKAFCTSCRKVSQINGMYHDKNNDLYYHESCLPND